MPTPGERFDRAGGAAYKPESRALDPRDVVVEPGWNVRDMTSPDTREHIAALKASILARGVDKAISVRYDKVSGITTLVDGQCRLTACRELWDEGHTIYVPAIRVTGDEAELTAESLSSNAGRPLTQWEIGAGCKRLVKFGWSIPQIAAHICKTVRYCTDSLALADVPLEAKEMLNEGSVTPGAVLHAVSGKDGDSLPALKERAKTADKPVARPKKPSATETTAKAAPNLLELADAMCRAIMDDDVLWEQLQLTATAYQKARGL